MTGMVIIAEEIQEHAYLPIYTFIMLLELSDGGSGAEVTRIRSEINLKGLGRSQC
jgi:hypothetical protein